jgi:hypothetical protein
MGATFYNSTKISKFKVIFHKRVRVFYQGFQTRENNGIHETVYQAIFIVL